MSDSIITKNILLLFFILNHLLIWHLIEIVSFDIILHHLLIRHLSEMKSFHLFFAIWILFVLANKLLLKCCPSFLNNKMEGKVVGSKLISCAYNLSMKKNDSPFCFCRVLLKYSQIMCNFCSTSSLRILLTLSSPFSGWGWGGWFVENFIIELTIVPSTNVDRE